MELIALWEVLRRRWWLIAIPTLVVFLSLLPTFSRMLNSTSSYSVAIRFTAASTADLKHKVKLANLSSLMN